MKTWRPHLIGRYRFDHVYELLLRVDVEPAVDIVDVRLCRGFRDAERLIDITCIASFCQQLVYLGLTRGKVVLLPDVGNLEPPRAHALLGFAHCQKPVPCIYGDGYGFGRWFVETVVCRGDVGERDVEACLAVVFEQIRCRIGTLVHERLREDIEYHDKAARDQQQGGIEPVRRPCQRDGQPHTSSPANERLFAHVPCGIELLEANELDAGIDNDDDLDGYHE